MRSVSTTAGPPPLGVAIAAWLLPGAGHWWLGERRRALGYGVSILALFVIALVISRGYAVSKREHPFAFWLQLPAGAPALIGATLEPAAAAETADVRRTDVAPWRRAVLARRGRPPVVSPPPDEVVATMDLALTYSMVAGLLNLLLIHDAWEAAQRRRGKRP